MALSKTNKCWSATSGRPQAPHSDVTVKFQNLLSECPYCSVGLHLPTDRAKTGVQLNWLEVQTSVKLREEIRSEPPEAETSVSHSETPDESSVSPSPGPPGQIKEQLVMLL